MVLAFANPIAIALFLGQDKLYEYLQYADLYSTFPLMYVAMLRWGLRGEPAEVHLLDLRSSLTVIFCCAKRPTNVHPELDEPSS